MVAERGTIYVDAGGGNDNELLWVKTSVYPASTGWVSMRSYVANESALPTGMVFPFIGNPLVPPAGSVWANGQLLVNATPANVPLFNLIGNSAILPGIPFVGFVYNF